MKCPLCKLMALFRKQPKKPAVIITFSGDLIENSAVHREKWQREIIAAVEEAFRNAQR